MGESGVAREQIHTKRCHFVLLHVLVLIHKQLPGFCFFCQFSFIFPPLEASWSLVGLRLFSESLRAAETPTSRFSDARFLPSLLSEVCLGFARWSEICSGWVGGGGGVASTEMRRSGNAQIGAWLHRPRENQRSTHQVSSGLGYFKKTDAMRVLTLRSRAGSVCVCVSSSSSTLLWLGIVLHIMKK